MGEPIDKPHILHITFAGTIEVFKSLNPTGERKINLNFGASPVGSVKAFENLVEQLRKIQ
jgi:hypothetical protein